VLISDVIRLGLAHAAEIDSVAVKSQISVNDSDEPRFAEYQIGRHLVSFGSINRQPVNQKNDFFRLTGYIPSTGHEC